MEIEIITIRLAVELMADREGSDQEFLTETRGTILLEDQEIGSFTLMRLQYSAAEDSGLLWDTCDGHSTELAEVAEAGLPELSRDFYQDSLLQRVLLVQRIEIDMKYRGRGFGTSVLKQITKYYDDWCSLIVIKPFCIDPIDKDSDAEAEDTRKRLQRLYERVGFRLCRNELMTLCPLWIEQPSLAVAKTERAKWMRKQKRKSA